MVDTFKLEKVHTKNNSTHAQLHARKCIIHKRSSNLEKERMQVYQLKVLKKDSTNYQGANKYKYF